MQPAKPKIPPVVVVLVTGGLMWAVARWLPIGSLVFPGRWLVAGLLTVLGILVITLGVLRFVRAKTTVNPLEPARATALVTHGIYALTRNPMYLGLLVLLLAWAVVLTNGFTLLLLPAYVWFMNRFQIRAEEAAMTQRFGAEYTDYQRRVRRWI